MAFSGGYGATVRLDKVPYKGKDKRNDTVFFAESNSRLIVEVETKNQKKFERLFQDSAHAVIGVVDQTPGLVVYGLNGEVCVHSTLDVLKHAWQQPLQA
jgi:phosphoribosylformylglycinamidine (FGAM) synthase-like enzyme